MAQQKSQLMDGYEKHQLLNKRTFARQRREEYPLHMCRMILEDTAARVRESRREFSWKFFRGDCHSHTQHSDGIGTVEETATMVRAAELDFQFVTDHWGVTQAPECEEHGLWYGQEPVTQWHHMGILGLNHAFTPQMDFYADLAEAERQGATVFVPHPTGWWPKTVYKDEQVKALEKLPDPFLMEICNGANNIVSMFDYTDDSALALWDRLLMQGKTVHAMGNTDAHAPHCIGGVWNGVFTTRCTQSAILKALRAGHSFVSDAPLVHLQLGKAGMGDAADKEDRADDLQITAVDSRGLLHAALIADGREARAWSLRNTTKFSVDLALPRSAKTYVRLEVTSRDGRRAFTNPIYLGNGR